MSNFNNTEGSLAFWAKNSLPQPKHHWKLNESASDSVIFYAGIESDLSEWTTIVENGGTVTRDTPGLNGTSGKLDCNRTGGDTNDVPCRSRTICSRESRDFTNNSSCLSIRGKSRNTQQFNWHLLSISKRA